MIKPAKRQIIQTVILCTVMLLMTFSIHAGFVLGFWLLFLKLMYGANLSALSNGIADGAGLKGADFPKL
jgi:hypothetical protein